MSDVFDLHWLVSRAGLCLGSDIVGSDVLYTPCAKEERWHIYLSCKKIKTLSRWLILLSAIIPNSAT